MFDLKKMMEVIKLYKVEARYSEMLSYMELD